jgi:glycosyltransferase involved in cell wall biosynthesis
VFVYADLRWPPKTGIGAVQTELLRRTPAAIDIVDLGVATRIGSPVSPLAIGRALRRPLQAGSAFWSPGFVPPSTSKLASVVTVHDLIHLHYHTKFHAMYYNVVLKRLYRRCSAVICVSEYTRREFLEWSGLSPNSVFTVHNGVSSKFFDEGAKFRLPFPYIFYPGNRRAHKNLESLFDAYALSPLARLGVHLVLTGAADEKLSRKAVELGIEASVHFVGSVDDTELVQLYRGAVLTAFVSLYEGFGLPILESMAAGVPVLTSNVTAMPEVAGNAALMVDPKSVPSIAQGLEDLCCDQQLRGRLIDLGRARASQFTWDVCATKVWDIVARIAGESL